MNTTMHRSPSSALTRMLSITLLFIMGWTTLPETALAQRPNRTRTTERSGKSEVVRRDDRSDRAERRDDRQEDRQEFREDRRDDRRHHYHRHGHVVVDLPDRHVTVRVGGTSYYYFGGVYYRPGPTGYVVVAAPIGAVIAAPPVGYTTVYVGGTPYYYYYGSYYVWRPGVGYVVVDAPVGATVTYMPDGYTTVYVGGVRYYRFGGVYYRPQYRNGATVYVSVRL